MYDSELSITFGNEETSNEETRSEEATSDEESFAFYEIDSDNGVGILTLTSCINNAEYKECVRDFFNQVKKNNIKHVVVDLRNNGGGNSSVANEFIRYLGVKEIKTGTSRWRMGPFILDFDENMSSIDPIKELAYDGDVYVMTSVSTFSSATLFAEYY